MSAETLPPMDDAFVDRLLAHPESRVFECKRVGKVDRLLESVVAFANTDGGVLVLGLDDPDRAQGRDRVFGIQEHPMNWDELRRKLRSRITEPDQLPVTHQEVGCTLRDGSRGSLILLKTQKSSRIHSIVDDGTFVRLSTQGFRSAVRKRLALTCLHLRQFPSDSNLQFHLVHVAGAHRLPFYRRQLGLGNRHGVV